MSKALDSIVKAIGHGVIDDAYKFTIKQEGGIYDTIYKDTKGHPTIGAGINLDISRWKELALDLGLEGSSMRYECAELLTQSVYNTMLVDMTRFFGLTHLKKLNRSQFMITFDSVVNAGLIFKKARKALIEGDMKQFMFEINDYKGLTKNRLFDRFKLVLEDMYD